MKSLGNILITGGAGYIGSHVVKALVQANAGSLFILDNLSTGFKAALPSSVLFIEGDVRDQALVQSIMQAHQINAVIHLAAASVIPESIENPLKYYQNNTLGTLNLLQACVETQVSYFIFSSTSSVYGISHEYIQESTPTAPANPYGASKLMSEKIIQDTALRHGLRFVNLRYFNVAGADPQREIGQRTPNATHLIKVAVQTACHLRDTLPIYGTTYPTPDGTCIRDFIHVSDIADLHLQALLYLQNGGHNTTLNCGYGHGFSIKEVIKAVEAVSGQPLPVSFVAPRQGDLPILVADNTQIKQILQWEPKFDDLHFIVKTAWEWEKKLQSLNA